MENHSIGANSSASVFHSIEAASGFEDIAIIEFAINDYGFVKNYGLENWKLVFESVTRHTIKRLPSAKVIFLILGRRAPQNPEIVDKIRRFTTDLSINYSAALIDFDSMVKQPVENSDFFMDQIYRDAAHYRKPYITGYLGSVIAGKITAILSSCRETSSPARMPPAIMSGTMDSIKTIRFSEVETPGLATVKTFENSQYKIEALFLPKGETLEIKIENSALSLGFLATDEGCDVVFEHSTGDSVGVNTTHNKVQSGDFSFLIKTLPLTIGRWRSTGSNTVKIRATDLSALNKTDGFHFIKEFNMTPNKNGRGVYLTGLSFG